MGVAEATFNSEEYKAPVRALLENNGYKKKMGVTGKIIIGVSVLAVLLIVFAIFAFVVPTLNKKAVTKDDFATIAENSGYVTIEDIELGNIEKETEEAIFAYDEEDDYQIEFYVFSDTDFAKRLFEVNSNNFMNESNKSSSGTHSPNYESCCVKTDGSYRYVARIENTLLYIDVYKKHTDEVKEFVKKLGY